MRVKLALQYGVKREPGAFATSTIEGEVVASDLGGVTIRDDVSNKLFWFPNTSVQYAEILLEDEDD